MVKPAGGPDTSAIVFNPGFVVFDVRSYSSFVAATGRAPAPGHFPVRRKRRHGALWRNVGPRTGGAGMAGRPGRAARRPRGRRGRELRPDDPGAVRLQPAGRVAPGTERATEPARDR